MTTHFDSRLSDRNFASHLLHVGELLEWAKSKRLHLKTTPPVNDFEFIQVEALLSAIQRNANNLTPDEALEIVLNDPVLKGDPIFQKYPDDIDPSTCRWLLGAEAHRKWRELLSGAIAAHELELLDFGSKLPIKTAQAQTASNPPPQNTATGAPPLKQPSQEARILELLKAQGYDPINLAERIPGKSGPKAEVRTLALTEVKLFTRISFDKAWERLRITGDIAGAE